MYLNIVSLGTLCVLLALKTPAPADLPNWGLTEEITHCSQYGGQNTTPALTSEKVPWKFNVDNEFVWRLDPEEDGKLEKENDTWKSEVVIQNLTSTLIVAVKIEALNPNKELYNKGTMPTPHNAYLTVGREGSIPDSFHSTKCWMLALSWLCHWMVFRYECLRRGFDNLRRKLKTPKENKPEVAKGKRRRWRPKGVKRTKDVESSDVVIKEEERNCSKVKVPNEDRKKTTVTPTDLNAIRHKRNRRKRRHRAQTIASRTQTAVTRH